MHACVRVCVNDDDDDDEEEVEEETLFVNGIVTVGAV